MATGASLNAMRKASLGRLMPLRRGRGGGGCSLITLWVTISLISCGRGNETTERFLEAAVTSYDVTDASLWPYISAPSRRESARSFAAPQRGLALIGSSAFLPAGCKKGFAAIQLCGDHDELRVPNKLMIFFYNVLRCILIFENEVSGVIRFGFCRPVLYVWCL